MHAKRKAVAHMRSFVSLVGCGHLELAAARGLVLALCLIEMQPLAALGWVYPEHRDISVLAVAQLNPAQRVSLQELWSEARAGHEERLCSDLAATTQNRVPTCIDYAAWPAIAGDHSCSARDMLNNVLGTSWILAVARVGARLKAQLSTATRREQYVNAVRDSDLGLVRIDPDYVVRARTNNAHFLLTRPEVAIEAEAYARLALGPEAELNAAAAYVWYHLRALAQAERIFRGYAGSEVRSHVVLAALADEAFALHFLQDSFAAGHVVGTWGNAALRTGTHDYYSERGVEVTTWNHRRFVALGDANMRLEDAERVAAAVADSLGQLIGAFEGKVEVDLSNSEVAEADGFDVCRESRFPEGVGKAADIRLSMAIIEQTPRPTLGTALGQLPRFRAELGPFIGLSTAVSGVALTRGFGSRQSGVSAAGGVDAAVRVGVGLEGVLDESSDGLAFAEFGLRENAPANGSFSISSRRAIAIRWRAPFWLIPGDLMLAAPVLALASPQKLQKMAVRAANGGLIPWQSGIATRIGRFQFVLGREVSLNFYNHGGDHGILVSTPGSTPISRTHVALNSIELALPILEYRLFRTFSLDQSSGLAIQPYLGFDKPTGFSVVSPSGAPTPNLHTIVIAGVRVVFDWRHYLN